MLYRFPKAPWSYLRYSLTFYPFITARVFYRKTAFTGVFSA
ncbi:hypothetical protein SPWS13_3402 [Shewanella putrefaciens]|nr:hypothetical protein SPWS13_3402 [Shewanella putrefaciens]